MATFSIVSAAVFVEISIGNWNFPAIFTLYFEHAMHRSGKLPLVSVIAVVVLEDLLLDSTPE